jgi:hypothetical protein
MSKVLRWGRRGYSQSRQQIFDALDLSPEERASLDHCGATFHTPERSYGCPLAPEHEGEHWSDKRWGR